MAKQILFYNNDQNETYGGILLDNGDIICGCCGNLFEKGNENIEIVEISPVWIDISRDIKGY